MTNAEYLATKDIDYLAEIINDFVYEGCTGCPADKDCRKWRTTVLKMSCYDFIRWWLEQEAKEDAEIKIL